MRSEINKFFVNFAVISMFVLSITVYASAGNRLAVMDFSKWDMPTIVNDTVIPVLAEDYIEGDQGLSLKITFVGRGFCGRKNVEKPWSDFKYFKFSAYNAQNKNLTFSLVIKDKNSISSRKNMDTWIVLPFVLKPGMNRVSLNLKKAEHFGDKKKIDLSEIKQWHFSYKLFPEQKWEETGPEQVVIYISDIRVEN
ncbi:MAG: hypothetical protein A2252_06705 [Elusimicrobia bacterium RIFOXYA2_FULL_39_19]|nr:MAG: hypothetical protein A2252_06705 [Elusimicrobia bacterium RIFOXYA2_FULL_39_19]